MEQFAKGQGALMRSSHDWHVLGADVSKGPWKVSLEICPQKKPIVTLETITPADEGRRKGVGESIIDSLVNDGALLGFDRDHSRMKSATFSDFLDPHPPLSL